MNLQNGFWLIPTYGRVDTNVPRFLRHAKATGITTPGVFVVDQTDYAANNEAYDALELPDNWRVHVVKGGSCGQATREAMADLFTDDMEWMGWLADDLIPMTPEWDVKAISQLNGWHFVSTDDGKDAPAKANGATVWSGDLLRAVGYLYPPGLWHMYPDTAWEELGRATGCWTVDMSILVKHMHAGHSGAKDDTYARSNRHWADDDRAFIEWKKTEKAGAVDRIHDLMATYGVQVYRPDLAGIEVMLATPCGSGRYERVFMESLRQTELAVKEYGGQLRFAEIAYCSDPALARNRIFGAFLNSSCTHLFMIDDDQGWNPQDFVRFLLSGKDFIAAAGVRKVSPPSFAVNVSDNMGQSIPIEVDAVTGHLKVTGVGAAFVCLSRQGIERMAQQYVDLQFESAEGRTEWGVFNPLIVNRRYLGEDYAYCHRWREIGGEIWVDSTVNLKHVGSFVWTGAWLDQLAAKIAEEKTAA